MAPESKGQRDGGWGRGSHTAPHAPAQQPMCLQTQMVNASAGPPLLCPVSAHSRG